MEPFQGIIQHAKDGEFDEVFRKLPPLMEHVNTIPGERKFGLLHQAAFWGDDDAIRRLVVDFGARMDVLTKEETPRTALDVAHDEGKHKSAKYLDALAAASMPASVPMPDSRATPPPKKKAKKSHQPDAALTPEAASPAKAGKGYYEQIERVRYKRALLDKARGALPGLISRELAEAIWEEALGRGVTEVEWNTIKYIITGHGRGMPGISAEAEEYLRQQLDKKDNACWSKAVQDTVACTVAEPVPAGATAVKVKSGHMFQPGDELKINGHYYRIYRVSGGTLTIDALRDDVASGTDVARPNLSLIGWKDTLDGATKAFIDTIENYDPSKQASADKILLDSLGPDEGKLADKEEDLKQRRRQLLAAYIREKPNLYSLLVNGPLRENDREKMYKYAGYVRELRDCFKVDERGQILRPFCGQTVWRGETVDEPRMAEFLQRWSKGEEVTFAAFTSTSFRAGKCLMEGRNLQFRIRCFKFVEKGQPPPGKYFPAKIDSLGSEFSQFDEAEVLWPPQSKFRIVNIRKKKEVVVVDMETCEWPSIWEIIEDCAKKGDWGKFKEYAEENHDAIDTSDAEYSVIGAVCTAMAKNPQVALAEPIEMCVDKGADVDEVDKETGKSAAMTIAEHLKEALPGGSDPDAAKADPLKSVLQVFHDHDADFVEVHKVVPKKDLSFTADGGYYKQENNVKYVRALLRMAERQKHIGVRQAKILLAQAHKGRGITETKKTTLSRILEGRQEKSALLQEVKFTPAGRKHLQNNKPR